MAWQPLPSAEQVAGYLDWSAEDTSVIEPHLASVTAFVRAYVRGVGFSELTDGTALCQPDLAAVIVTATARSVPNPSHVVREEVGSYSVVPGRFDGFTLVEQAVLHQHRRRTA